MYVYMGIYMVVNTCIGVYIYVKKRLRIGGKNVELSICIILTLCIIVYIYMYIYMYICMYISTCLGLG
jgi:hypothetical protein